jgi:ATPase subunit of ABC transporter with duplicated ATPase domains
MRTQIVKTFKGIELLKGVSWECKKGDRLGLVGVNGAGKTTQLQILMGNLDPDSGDVLKSRRNLHIGFLQQEFDIVPTRTVREELASAFAEGMAVLQRTEEIQKELEECTEDMDRMSRLLDELDKVSNKAVDLDMTTLDKQIEQMMPQLGFSPEDNKRCACLSTRLLPPRLFPQSSVCKRAIAGHTTQLAPGLPHCTHHCQRATPRFQRSEYG